MEIKGYRVARFYEPDLENQLTAIAVEPAAQKQLSSLRLAGWTEKVKIVEKIVNVPTPSLWERLRKKLAA